jgi:hypothetical protein
MLLLRFYLLALSDSGGFSWSEFPIFEDVFRKSGYSYVTIIRFHTRNYVDGAELGVTFTRQEPKSGLHTARRWLVFVSPTTHSLLKLGVSNMPLVGLLITDGRDQNLLHDDFVNMWCLRLCAHVHLIEFWLIWSFCYCDASKTRGVQLKTEPDARQTVALHFLMRACVRVYVCSCVICNTTYCMLAVGNDLLQFSDMLDLVNSFINYCLKYLSWNSRYCATSLMAVAWLHTLPVLSPRMRLHCILITLSSVTSVSLVCECALQLSTEDFPCGNIHKGEKAWKVS